MNSQDKGKGILIPEHLYAFIDEDIRKSITDFRLELYDKFIIMNIVPDYNSPQIISLLKKFMIYDQDAFVIKGGIQNAIKEFFRKSVKKEHEKEE